MKSDHRIRAVMLDWAGTTVDHGSLAPVFALQTLFSKHGIELSRENARKDMGLAKRDHIRAILGLLGVRSQWRLLHGTDPEETNVETLFDEFSPLQLEIIAQHSQLLPGVAETVAAWKDRSLRIGSSTGYTREMLSAVMARAAQAGFSPDASVCPDEAGGGRPYPWMLMRNAQLLDAYPPSLCVKIGDTISDIEEGRNAGMWTIGITRTGNLIGLDADQWAELPEAEKQSRLAAAERQFIDAGADFIAEDIPACDKILLQIEDRLQRSKNGLDA
jgi:phosphonoacetaldehyde hydrolase